MIRKEFIVPTYLHILQFVLQGKASKDCKFKVIICRYIYKFCMKYFYVLTVTDMMVLQNFEILLYRFNVDRIYTNGNYMHTLLLLIYSSCQPYHTDCSM
jgi:hypothetical protein